LDEIAELDASLQAKLLHVLQDGRFTRIGDHEEKRMEARVICATNRQLQLEIEAGGFRSDLFYRINVISIVLPPLRERRDDIPIVRNISGSSSTVGSSGMQLRFQKKRSNS
jgi:transcriptional regulator with PAS, ATPase and Fis domain